MASIEYIHPQKRLKFSVRGTPYELYEDASIFNYSKYLDAIKSRWSSDNNDVYFINFDPTTFGFIVTLLEQFREEELSHNTTHTQIHKLFIKQLMDNPMALYTIKTLEIDLNLSELITIPKWSCKNSNVYCLSNAMDVCWHYSDCFVYLLFMLQEQPEFQPYITNISIIVGYEDGPTTKLHVLSVTIGFLIDMRTHSLIVNIGEQNRGTYQHQINSIYYGTYETFLYKLNVTLKKFDEKSSYIKTSPYIQKYFNMIKHYMRGGNNPLLRKMSI